jgi:hypothetical protein
MVSRAVAQAERTRAAIRLPLGSATRMVIGWPGSTARCWLSSGCHRNCEVR